MPHSIRILILLLFMGGWSLNANAYFGATPASVHGQEYSVTPKSKTKKAKKKQKKKPKKTLRSKHIKSSKSKGIKGLQLGVGILNIIGLFVLSAGAIWTGGAVIGLALVGLIILAVAQLFSMILLFRGGYLSKWLLLINLIGGIVLFIVGLHLSLLLMWVAGLAMFSWVLITLILFLAFALQFTKLA